MLLGGNHNSATCCVYDGVKPPPSRRPNNRRSFQASITISIQYFDFQHAILAQCKSTNKSKITHKHVFSFSLVFKGHQILGDSTNLQQLIFSHNTLTAGSSLGLIPLQSMVHLRAGNIANAVPLLGPPLLQRSTSTLTEGLPPS